MQISKPISVLRNYVKYILNKKYRSVLAQFRCEVLPLKVETGRFNNIPLEYRLCEFCDKNNIEDESHFLLYCSRYENLRIQLFQKAIMIHPHFNELNTHEKLKLLMNSTEIIKYTAQFIAEAREMRNGLLYHNLSCRYM